LSSRLRDEVADRIVGLDMDSARPIICPFLDREAGACLVYDSRPLACRAYGFYVERGLGLYCDKIEAAVHRGELSDVVWGNQLTIEAASQKLAPARTLLDWVRAEFLPLKPDSNGD
jgi:uncharacterized protein